MAAARALLLIGVAALCASGAPAWADFQLCNRMSYVIDAAIGMEDRGAVITRGWFRLDPGQCRVAVPGETQAESYYLHARALPLYGAAPTPQSGHLDLCVGQDNFTISNARSCGGAGQRMARFTAIKPTPSEQNLTANFAEEAEYTNEQARDAGIQRLLVIAGYDATPIDGVRGAKTDAVLMQFLKDNNLAPTSAGRSDIFDVLIAAALKPEGAGLAWCNETAYPVMAAVGIEDKSGIITRGWYRVSPGACVRPELSGRPSRVYSFAEAVDGNGQALKSAEHSFKWGGDTILCTRNTRFELLDQKDCRLKGLNAAGFALIELSSGGTTVRFR